MCALTLPRIWKTTRVQPIYVQNAKKWKRSFELWIFIFFSHLKLKSPWQVLNRTKAKLKRTGGKSSAVCSRCSSDWNVGTDSFVRDLQYSCIRDLTYVMYNRIIKNLTVLVQIPVLDVLIFLLLFLLRWHKYNSIICFKYNNKKFSDSFIFLENTTERTHNVHL